MCAFMLHECVSVYLCLQMLKSNIMHIFVIMHAYFIWAMYDYLCAL